MCIFKIIVSPVEWCLSSLWQRISGNGSSSKSSIADNIVKPRWQVIFSIFTQSTFLGPYRWASLVAEMVKNQSTMWETWVWSPGGEDPLEEGMASVFLPGESPWTGEFGGPCPWGRKESDTTVRLSIHTYFRCVSCKQHRVVFLNPSLTIIVFFLLILWRQ